jgi:hypothetical protein
MVLDRQGSCYGPAMSIKCRQSYAESGQCNERHLSHVKADVLEWSLHHIEGEYVQQTQREFIKLITSSRQGGFAGRGLSVQEQAADVSTFPKWVECSLLGLWGAAAIVNPETECNL